MRRLLLAIKAGDYSSPVPRCGALIRQATLRGLIRPGVEQRRPYELTPAGHKALTTGIGLFSVLPGGGARW